ncbi:MAG: prepilin-type N-terminal cleavage/methylation domain-containing protein [Elusimicrobia bacterium]|nr:prepilin-type N-terminal cleavage/methylation domain-containing protein [Candidatus Liberimonas magnetica]
MSRKFFSKKSNGFSMIELVVVLVIIGIAAVMSIPYFTSYQRKAYAGEGQALCNSVAAAEKAFYAERNAFWAGSGAAGNTIIGTFSVDTGHNSFFRTFSVTTTATTFTIIADAESPGKAAGIRVTYVGSLTADPVTTITGI